MTISRIPNDEGGEEIPKDSIQHGSQKKVGTLLPVGSLAHACR